MHTFATVPRIYADTPLLGTVMTSVVGACDLCVERLRFLYSKLLVTNYIVYLNPEASAVSHPSRNVEDCDAINSAC
jgi:hypothetical protein